MTKTEAGRKAKNSQLGNQKSEADKKKAAKKRGDEEGIAGNEATESHALE